MDPDKPNISVADVVMATAGREANELFYVIGTEGVYVLLADGKGRKLEKPKRKKCKHIKKFFALRPESPRVFAPATKCSTVNYAGIWLI